MRDWIGMRLVTLACWLTGAECPCDFCIIWGEDWEPHGQAD